MVASDVGFEDVVFVEFVDWVPFTRPVSVTVVFPEVVLVTSVLLPEVDEVVVVDDGRIASSLGLDVVLLVS